MRNEAFDKGNFDAPEGQLGYEPGACKHKSPPKVEQVRCNLRFDEYGLRPD